MERRIIETVLVCLLMVWGLTGCGTASNAQAGSSSREEGQLAMAPNVPPPFSGRGARR